ncbi:sensor histidine kinase [Paenibacillus sp. 1011MAR3C5]|uniref:sensor histidine kinase n=1 Tax=Paenibacillus sp. 1011MAR3C5 TaxID=1675787 RepID=UPI000E6C241F|nr:HAMP domain-containing sensor histidine kinase [Paenibacillus sp. 1011MAR3C5]RJE84783.1 sensor histidine kinase [Paenibacillus sp. 1011MAR3C5]
MFRKTKARLTLLNASVMFLILAMLGTSMYVYLRTAIIGKIDHAMQTRAAEYSMQQPEMTFLFTGGIATRIASLGTWSATASTFERTINMIIWDEGLNPLTTLIPERYPYQLVEKLRRTFHKTELFNVRHDGAVYRVINIQINADNAKRLNYVSVPDKDSYIQLISDISTEISMLNVVMGLIIIGIVFGAGLSVFAGLYLADRALVPIRSSWEKQQQFVADASHELRTPLAVLQTHTELLLRHPDHTIEQDSREISTILNEIRRMKKLVNGLLTLSQTDADKLELQMKPVSLGRLAEQVLGQVMPLASLKDIALSWHVNPNLRVNGDEERLQQLLMIVLDNAIKYTPNCGSVHLTCTAASGHVTLTVKDNGNGVAAADLPHIFDRFYRGDKGRTRTEGGAGLGLSIAKWIVLRHGGRIEAASVQQQGTKITFTLPAL